MSREDRNFTTEGTEMNEYTEITELANKLASSCQGFLNRGIEIQMTISPVPGELPLQWMPRGWVPTVKDYGCYYVTKLAPEEWDQEAYVVQWPAVGIGPDSITLGDGRCIDPEDFDLFLWCRIPQSPELPESLRKKHDPEIEPRRTQR